MSWHAGKTTFFSKNTSILKCKIIKKWSQKQSWSGPRDTSKEKQQQSTKKSTKKFQKSTERLCKMTPKRILKSHKAVWVAFFPHQKNENLEAVFSSLLAPPGGPRPSKSSQNAIMVCKNEGPTFSRKAVLFYKN